MTETPSQIKYHCHEDVLPGARTSAFSRSLRTEQRETPHALRIHIDHEICRDGEVLSSR